jgi:peptide/nickel transport system permease protein
MLAFILRRLLLACLSVFLAAVLVFGALLAIPGDPATAILGLNASPEALAAVRQQLRLDEPPVARFLSWFGGILRGDFGISLTYRTPVRELLADRLAVSLPLALGGMLVACALALPLGTLAALRRGSWLDPAVSAAAQLGAAVPSFWLGLLLILLFSVELGWFPAGGYVAWREDPLASARSLVLPTLALGLGQAAVITRMTRSALLETLAQDYVRTAKAKGLSRRSVVFKHGFRNALVTLITVLGLSFAQVLVGAIVIEQVFSLPGLGRLALTAIGTRDFPLLQGEVFVYASIIVFLSFIVDLAYGLLDPRIRYD